jgi:hypothetical protein
MGKKQYFVWMNTVFFRSIFSSGVKELVRINNLEKANPLC